MTSRTDDDVSVRNKRAKGAGVSAFILSWLLIDPTLSISKIVMMNVFEKTGPDEKSPMWGLQYDGWWISLIIAAAVGLMVWASVDQDLQPVERFSGSRAEIAWWGSFLKPILLGIAAYHLLWLFHEPTGLVF